MCDENLNNEWARTGVKTTGHHNLAAEVAEQLKYFTNIYKSCKKRHLFQQHAQ